MVYRPVFWSTWAISDCLWTSWSTLQWFRVCHQAICDMRSATSRSEVEKTPGQGKLSLSSFNVPVSIAAALCNSKSWKTWTLSTSLLSSFRLQNLFQVEKVWREQHSLHSHFKLWAGVGIGFCKKKKSENFSSVLINLARKKTHLQSHVPNESPLSTMLSV